MRECKRCNKIFDNSGRYQKFCMKCTRPKGFITGGKYGDKKICPTCGKEFIIEDYNRKYCSNKCYKTR